MKKSLQEIEVIEYIRNESLSSWFLFKLWLFAITPCWIVGHRISYKDNAKFSLGEKVYCKKCKHLIS